MAGGSFPPLLAITITEIVNVEMSAHTPFPHGNWNNVIWQILQGFAGWVFGWVSDKHWRQNVLIIAQLLGAIGGVALIIFGFSPLTLTVDP